MNKVAPRAYSVRRKLTSASGQRNECCACHEYFAKNKTFASHRIGKFGWNKVKNTRRCLTPDEMKAKGYTKNEDDYWITPATKDGAEYFKQLRAKT